MGPSNGSRASSPKGESTQDGPSRSRASSTSQDRAQPLVIDRHEARRQRRRRMAALVAVASVQLCGSSQSAAQGPVITMVQFPVMRRASAPRAQQEPRSAAMEALLAVVNAELEELRARQREEEKQDDGGEDETDEEEEEDEEDREEGQEGDQAHSENAGARVGRRQGL